MIPVDKMQHFAMGLMAIGVLALAHAVPLGMALALGTTAFGVFYELQQWYRKEGVPDVLDALATALPGWLAWLVLEVVQ